MGVCNAAKAPVYERWKEAELQLSDAAGESRETVKYLATLEGNLECLYTSELGGGGEGVAGWAGGGQWLGMAVGLGEVNHLEMARTWGGHDAWHFECQGP